MCSAFRGGARPSRPPPPGSAYGYFSELKDLSLDGLAM